MVTTRTLHEGMVVDATVFKMYDWGMLIRLQNGLKAVVMKEECADHEVASARELYTEGDKVRAVITKVDLTNHKTEASLKPSRLPQETAVEAEEESVGDGGGGEEQMRKMEQATSERILMREELMRSLMERMKAYQQALMEVVRSPLCYKHAIQK